MKLLDWMHRKLKHNSTESLKSFSIGNVTMNLIDTENSAFVPLNEQRHHAEPMFSHAWSRKPNMKYQTFITDNKSNKEEPFYEVFQGFLAIGTLDLESSNTEPTTPTFPNVTNEEMDITENHLKLINDKLEKIFEDEEVERSSNASIVTICNNLIEDVNAEDYGNMLACPLQNYLFGSLVESSKIEVQMKKEKTTLGDLFKRNTVHEGLQVKYENEEKLVKERYATRFMKKMLKKKLRTFKASCDGDADHSALTKRKLLKVLKVFDKRVHPEELMSEKKQPKFNKIGKILCMCSYEEEEHEENIKSPSRKEINSLNLSSDRVSNVFSTPTREHWINTDDDYLVLEL